MRLARWAVFASLTVAVIGHVDALASNNLLPRRMGLHLAAVVACAVALRARGRIPPWPLAALAAWSAFAWAVSPVSQAAVVGLLDVVAACCLCGAVASGVPPRRPLLSLMAVLGVVGAGLGLLGQYVPLPFPEATRPASWFASRATAGAFVVATMPLVWGWFGRRAWVPPLATAVQIAFIVSTRARVAWAAAVVAILAVALCFPGKAWRLLAASGLGLLLAVVATPGPRLRWVADAPYADSLGTLSSLDLGHRRGIWHEAAGVALERPWGWGPGSFEAAFAPSAPRETRLSIRVESPHNELLRLAFELGLPGLLFSGLLLSGLARRASRRTWLLRAATSALFVCALVGKTFAEPPTAVLACCLVGLQLRAARRGRPGAAWRKVGVAALVAAALTTAVIDVRQVAASRALARARVLAGSGQPRAAWEAVEPGLTNQHDVGAWLWAVELLSRAGDVRRCQRIASDALARYPRHPLLLEWAARCAGH